VNQIECDLKGIMGRYSRLDELGYSGFKALYHHMKELVGNWRCVG